MCISGKPISAISCLGFLYQLLAGGYLFWRKSLKPSFFLQFKDEKALNFKTIPSDPAVKQYL
jgi:hypothetical protein